MRKRPKDTDTPPATPRDLSRWAALTDRDIARHVVRFANTGDARDGEWLRSGYAPRVTTGAKPIQHAEFPALVAQLHADMQRVARFRAALREGEPVSDFRDFFFSLAADVRSVALHPMPRIRVHGKAASLETAYRMVPDNLRAALSYGLFLMSADNRDSADLCQCQRPGCGRFYLFRDVKEGNTGRDPLTYCGTECRDAARRAMNSANSAAYKRKARDAARAKAAARAKRRKK